MSISILWRHIFIAADKDHFLAHPETSLTVNVKKKIWSRCNFFLTQIPPAYEKSIRNSSSDHVNSKILGREPNFNIWRIEICALPAQSPLQESIYFAFFYFLDTGDLPNNLDPNGYDDRLQCATHLSRVLPRHVSSAHAGGSPPECSSSAGDKKLYITLRHPYFATM